MPANFLPLRTQRLVLRSFQSTDLDQVERYLMLPEVQRYLAWKIRDRLECKQLLETMCRQVSLQRPGDALAMAMTLRKAREEVLIGQVSLLWADATAAQGEIAVALSPEFRGQGYASEAIRAVVDLAFEEFRLHRVYCRTNARNIGAAALMKRLGFRLEAHFREHALYQGEWFDELHFAILDREWDRSSKVKELTVHRVA